jgi:hypothetical protein
LHRPGPASLLVSHSDASRPDCRGVTENMSENVGGKPRVYVNAMLCGSIIRHRENVLSAIGLADGYTVNPLKIISALPDGSPDETNAQYVYQPLNIAAVFTFRTEEPAEFIVTLKGVRPSGSPLFPSTDSFPITTGKGAEGNVMNVNFSITTEEEGDYWIEFYVDGALANKVPIRIMHGSQPVRIQLTGKSLSGESQPPAASE